MAQEPDFIAAREPIVGRAFRYADAIYSGPDVEEGAGIDHPISVATLMDAVGFTDEAVASAFLHDLVEDTSTSREEIEAEFGAEIGGYVATLTEDLSIADYGERKAEHRTRVLSSGSVPATIYLADKLARTRAISHAGERIDPQRLEHYRATLKLYAGRRPELPFLSELAVELPGLEAAAETA